MTASTHTRRRRQPTVAQQEAAAAKREAMRLITQRVSAMSEEQRSEMIDARGSLVTIEGHALSPFNHCFVLMQTERASVIGGYRQWLAAGRQVRKGEHGFGIWIPTSGSDSGAGEDADGVIDEKRSRQRFIIATMFDVSQTEPAE